MMRRAVLVYQSEQDVARLPMRSPGRREMCQYLSLATFVPHQAAAAGGPNLLLRRL